MKLFFAAFLSNVLINLEWYQTWMSKKVILNWAFFLANLNCSFVIFCFLIIKSFDEIHQFMTFHKESLKCFLLLPLWNNVPCTIHLFELTTVWSPKSGIQKSSKLKNLASKSSRLFFFTSNLQEKRKNNDCLWIKNFRF